MAAQAFEALMLACFGVSWPIDILKTLRARRVEGKSIAFMSLVFVGYVAGTVGKLLLARGTGQGIEPVTALYVLNAMFVAIDIGLCLRYR